jgi:hypothetical protein
MSASMTDISTPKTTNLYTTTKSTKFYIYDNKKNKKISRPCKSKVSDGEKPDNALHPSVIAIPDMATDKCIERSFVITHDDKYEYIQDDCIYNPTEPTQFCKNILKNPSYAITSTKLFIALSSLTHSEIQDNIAKNNCKIVCGFDGDEYIEITPTSNLKTIADKGLDDAIDRNDGDNRGTASDTDEFIKIKLCGVKGKFIFRTTYSVLILPSLSHDDDKYEEFVVGASFVNAPGVKTHIQIIPNNTTFKDESSENLGDLLTHFPDNTCLATSSDTFIITNVGINNVISIMKRRKQKPSVSFANNASLTHCGKGLLAVLNIDLTEVPTTTTTKQPTDYEFSACIDTSGSMYSYVDVRNNTNLRMNEKLFTKLKAHIATGTINKGVVRIANRAFDSKIIPEWSIEESIVCDSDNTHQILNDTKKKIDDIIKKQSARGSTDFTTCFNSTKLNKSMLLITDGCHNGSSDEDLLAKVKQFLNANCVYIALLGIGPNAYLPLLHKMAKVVRDNGHTCDVFSSTFFPGSDKVDPEINTDYDKILDKFTSILFEQTIYNIVLPEGCKIIHANMNNLTIDGNKIYFKASGGSVKFIVECPRTDDFNINVNDTKLSCDIMMQDNPLPMRNYIASREFYTDSNNKDTDTRIKSVNDWLITNCLTSCRVSSEYKWFQEFGDKVATKDDVVIPKQNTTPIILTPIGNNAVLTTLLEKVKDLDDEIKETYYPRRRGITRGPASDVTRSVTRSVTRGSMQAVFTQVEPTKNQPVKSVVIMPIEILQIQDINNFLAFNNTCHGEWTWDNIMIHNDITTYELLKKSHAVIAMIIDIDIKFKTIMNFKLHITNTINNLISIFENLKTTKSDYDNIFTSHSANIITTFSSVIDTIILDVARLKLNFTQYYDEFNVLSSNEHIKAVAQDTYLYDIFATQQTNHTILNTLIESFDKEIMRCPMKEDIITHFTPNPNMSD